MASIRKRKLPSGKTAWQVDYRDAENKRRHKQFATWRKADEWLVKERAQLASAHAPAAERLMIGEAGEAWIKDCERNGLERSTIEVYEQRLRDHITPFIGDKKLYEFSTADAHDFYEALLDRLRSRDMVRRVRINTGAILRYAQQKGWVSKNVIAVAPYKHSRREKKRPSMPTLREVRSMIDVTADKWRDRLAMLHTLIFCGLRASELRGLSWPDVDLRSNTMTIRQRADKWGRIGKPKSEAGTRDIPFPSALAQELRLWKVRCPPSELDLVFPTSTGTVQSHANIMNRYFRPMQIQAGICHKNESGKENRQTPPTIRAKYGMHALRHFCASLWIDADYSPKRVQKMMGHASIELTFDIYGHLFDGREKIEESLRKTQERVLAG